MEEIMVLLFSGGIDSYVAYHYLNKPQTVYFDVYSRYTSKEVDVVRELVPKTIIDYSLDLHDREYGEKAYIPFRNLLFACQAVKYSDTVVIAGVADDMVSDKNEAIFLEFSNLLTKLEGRPIDVMSPFWKMTKSQVVKWYMENIGDDNLLNTISCYSKEDTRYCGKCPSCFRKWIALRTNGLRLDFYNEELIDQYYKAALEEKYIPERNESIIREIDAWRSQ
jgi:7-cyano-7-deazaguanine synthase